MSLRYSIVIPVYNEEENLAILTQRLVPVLMNLPESAEGWEIIFVDDGSTDNSYAQLIQLRGEDLIHFKVIKFIRNFGQHSAVLAGLQRSSGKFVIVMDADLQDQPEEIPRLIKKAQEGFHLVYGKRVSRTDGMWRTFTSRFYFWALSKLTGQRVSSKLTTFKVMSRPAVNTFLKLRETPKMPGGLISWMGYRTAYISVAHGRRIHGKSHYNVIKMVRLATDGVLSFSTIPLYLITLLGVAIWCASCLFGLYVLGRKLWMGDIIAGYTSTIVMLCFLHGLSLTMVGIVGLYVGRIHEEVKQRPYYIVEEEPE